MAITRTPKRRYTRRQDLSKLRKPLGVFNSWLAGEVARISSTSRALRDRLRQLGPLSPVEVEGAADEDAAGIVNATITATFAEGDRLAGAPDLTFGAELAGAPAVGFIAPASFTGNLVFGDTNPDTISKVSGDFADDGFVVGGIITVSGTVSNNGTYTIAGIAANVITLVAGDALTTEGPVSSTLDQESGITRDAGDFAADGFVTDGLLRIEGSDLNNGLFLADVVGTTSLSFKPTTPVNGSEAQAAGITVLQTNTIVRSAGDFTSDGFANGEPIVVQGSASSDGGFTIGTAAATLLTLDEEAFAQVEALASAGATAVAGYDTLSRGVGDYVADGFAAGDLVRVTGAANAENDRDWPIEAVGTTVLDIAGIGVVAEASTPSVVLRVISERGRES